tara:strand:- start:498 stop:671 length:174 start_codon:yes stop_codon:yes gene_type:complete
MQTATNEKVKDLCQLLKEAQNLGLRFDIGNAYIRRAYIDAQNELNVKIDALLKGETA